MFNAHGRKQSVSTRIDQRQIDTMLFLFLSPIWVLGAWNNHLLGVVTYMNWWSLERCTSGLRNYYQKPILLRSVIEVNAVGGQEQMLGPGNIFLTDWMRFGSSIFARVMLCLVCFVRKLNIESILYFITLSDELSFCKQFWRGQRGLFAASL